MIWKSPNASTRRGTLRNRAPSRLLKRIAQAEQAQMQLAAGRLDQVLVLVSQRGAAELAALARAAAAARIGEGRQRVNGRE